jgi:metallophosphoesterase (TIGR00282 family)
LIESVNVLVLGDIVGRPGCRALFAGLKNIKQKTQADVVVVNGENASDGKGITPSDVEDFYRSGVDVITSGNHIWQKKEIIRTLQSDTRLLRPENYPVGVPGSGHCVITAKGISVGVCNLEGRLYLSDIRCPFKIGSEIVARLQKETNIIIVDFHAESPEEKEALALYLDGRVSAVVGTHTHVQTADERILPQGTGYITDIGMTGPKDSCIGMDIQIAVKRGLTQMPLKMEVANTAAEINGVFLKIDAVTGKTRSIRRIRESSAV